MPRPARASSRMDQAMLAACVLLALVALVLPAPQRAAVAGGLRGTIVVPLVTLQERAEVARRAILQHDASVRVADSVRLQAVQLDAVRGENHRLRQLLGLGAALKWGFVPAEALHGRGLGDDFTMTLTVGRNEGVQRFSPVVAPDGLVGMIETVDASSSVAIVWPHPDFRVSAMSADGMAFGIVYPHLGAGATRFLLELRGVAFRTELKPGTLIVSAGLGGVYPRGLPIGTVIQELRTAEGWARNYLVQPAVRPTDATAVMVIQPQRAAQGVSVAWQARVDSALRVIIRAGDSLNVADRHRLDSLQALLAPAKTVPAGTDSAARNGEKRPEANATQPAPKPVAPASKPASPAAKPTGPVAKPAESATKPAAPATRPAESATKPATPAAKPAAPTTKPAPRAPRADSTKPRPGRTP